MCWECLSSILYCFYDQWSSLFFPINEQNNEYNNIINNNKYDPKNLYLKINNKMTNTIKFNKKSLKKNISKCNNNNAIN